MKKHLVAPSLLAADFTRLQEEVNMVNESEGDWLHLDVMDGRFVPNITFGPFIIEAINKLSTKPLDVHLMIVEPGKYVEDFCKAGANSITVHYEACPHLHRNIQQIKDQQVLAGVAINPHTPVEALEDIIEDVDMVIVMSVNPGFGGQKFIYRSIPKIRKLKDMITVRNTATLISVDGGVGLQNAERILQAGADVLIAGSSVFKAKQPPEVISRLKDIGGEVMKFV